MSGKKNLIVFILSWTLFLNACGASHQAAVTGLIDHPHDMTLPLGTILTVQIIEETKAGSPGKKIAEEVIKDQEIDLPTPFVVVYDPGKINNNRTYGITVKIEDSGGKLLFTNENEVSIITHGGPTQGIDVSVRLVNP